LLGRKEQIVLLITGHGLKDVDAALKGVPLPVSVAPTMEGIDSLAARR
jgi:threonine synthase